jgi:hypothetical protein
MIRKTLIASTLVLCGTVGFTSAVKADDTTVDMIGDVAESCTFGTPVPGTLTLNGDGNALETTDTGSVPVTCNTTTAILTVNGVTDTNGFDGYDSNNVNVTFSVAGGGTPLTEGNIGSGDTTLPQGETTLTIDLTATENTGGILPAGTGYTYGVQLTAAPN